MAERSPRPCVSSAISWRTRSVSGSRSFGRISISQSMAYLHGLNKQGIDGVPVAGFEGQAKIFYAGAHRSQGVEHGLAVGGEDGGPEFRIAGGHARGVAEARR